MADPLMFNIIKYGTVIAPIVVPFILAFIVTKDIVQSLAITIIVDFLFMACVFALMLRWMPKQVEEDKVKKFTELKETVDKIQGK